MPFNCVGGLTVLWLATKLRLLFSHQPPPRVIILEIGTNDLSSQSPEFVVGDLLELVELLQSADSSTAAGVHVCKVLSWRHRSTGFPHEELWRAFWRSTVGLCVGTFGNAVPYPSSPSAWRCPIQLSSAVLSLSELQVCPIERGLFASQ